jgi:creatinine amidohydrolase
MNPLSLPRKSIMPGRPYILSETTWKTIRNTEYQLAVLPWGATEPHNYHLPYGTDTLEVEAVAAEAARLAWEAGARPLVLPAVPFGANAQQVDIPHTLNLNPSTQAYVLADLVESLEAQGITKLVLLNGHGGNEFRGMIRELQARTDVFLSLLSWYGVLDPREFFREPGDHGGEMETSLMLHLHPELVLPLREAGPGTARAFKVTALREGWAWAPRNWIQVTADTGVGDPAGATQELGDKFFRAVTERIASFFVELAAADVEDLYRS